jgi:hypothetical protein
MISENEYAYEVYVNLILSPAGHYLSRRPYIIGLIKEILASQELKGKRIVVERNMGRNIGTTDIVPTTATDNIYYAQPVKSETYSRFAKNKYPQPSEMLTVIFEKDEKGDYEVIDTWIGLNVPAFPGDSYETKESKEFWQNHALVHDAQNIQLKSITKDWPY